jgi:hypothetical protein
MKSLDLFEIKSERINGSNNKLIYVREKPQPQKNRHAKAN